MSRTPLAQPLLAAALALAACEPVKVPAGDDTGDTHGASTPDACDGLPGAVICAEGAALSCDADGDIASTQTCDAASELCLSGTGCAACGPALSVAYADEATLRATGAALIVDAEPVSAASFGWQRLAMRPLTLSSAEPIAGAYTLSADGDGLELYDEDGVALPLPATLDASTLPRTLLVRATTRGTWTLSATYTGEASCPVSDAVILRGVGEASLSGRPRAEAPWWESADTLHDTDDLYAALDPYRHAERVGLPYDAYVVAHRSPEQWAGDPSLSDQSGGAESLTLSGEGIESNTNILWSGDPDSGDGLGQPYDIVFDFGQDGRLDPGDLIDGLDADRAGVYVLGDLTTSGQHAVESFDHSGGSWLGQRVYYPADIASMGELPLIVISHGNGHDYTWYDYLGEHLASWGYVVMAHQNNTGPGIETASTTTVTNTDYLLSNADSIEDGVLYGHLDGTRIVWIGHSRGGEGVVRAYDRILDGDIEPVSFTAEDVVLISSIAPTVFNTVDDSDPHEVPYHLLAGAADGDVTGSVDCEQCQFFRIAQAAEGPVQVTYVQGADHNDFNCCGFDDGVGPDQIGREEVQAIARAYFLALIQTWVDDNPATRDYFTRMSDTFHPPTLDADDRLATTFRDAHAEGYPVLDDFQTGPDTAVSSAGTVVTATVDSLEEGALKDQDLSFAWSDEDPMNGMTQAVRPPDDARGAVFQFEAPATWAVEVPAEHQDFSSYGVLSLAVAQQSRAPQTEELAGDLSFTVTLVDAAGVESTVDIASQGAVPLPYQRSGSGSGRGWANELVTVRLPLSDFETGADLDLTHIASVRLNFGEGSGSAMGRIGLDNVELSR